MSTPADVGPAFPDLTLRDYFATHAPDVPTFFLPADLEKARQSITERPAIMAARFFEWRWFYADMMLRDRNL